MKCSIKYRSHLENVGIQTYTFESEDAFSRSFSINLLGLAEKGIVDLTGYDIIPGQVWEAEGNLQDESERYFSGDLRRCFDEEAVVYSDLMERYILMRYAHSTNRGDYATHEWFSDSAEYETVRDMNGWFHRDDMDEMVWCEDIEQYAHMEDTFYCDNDDCHYYDEDNARHHDVDPCCINGLSRY